jgi:2-C-methyl-D-erythritol 4-phosphate cytidylyltransferase
VSVHNGLELIATEFIGNEPEWVLIHDGARPFVESSDVSSLLNEGKRVARASVAMTLATRVTNTIKRARLAAKGGAIVVETPPRSELWEVQTPQLFSFQLILRAHRQLAGGDAEFTDDCQLVEAVGGEVRLIEGSRANIKVTAPGDL